MAGRRRTDVEQSLGPAPARPVRPRDAARHAPHPDQGQPADRLNGPKRGDWLPGISMKLQEIVLRKGRLPLIRPYVLSYRTFTEFEPIIVEVRCGDGRIGWGEGHISPGSSRETREGGWAFCREYAAAVVGKDTAEAKAVIAANVGASKVAATALLTAIEMLEDYPLL